MKPWHIDALIEGWFPLVREHLRENKTALLSREW